MSVGRMDYYALLNVSKDASTAEINQSYYKLAKKYHPDRNSEPDANDKMKLLNTAHEILTDPEKRRRYDLGAEVENEPVSSAKESQDLGAQQLKNWIEKLKAEKDDQDAAFYRQSSFIQNLEAFLTAIKKEDKSARIKLRNNEFLIAINKMIEELLKRQNDSEMIMYEYGLQILSAFNEYDKDKPVDDLLRLLGLMDEDKEFNIAEQLVFNVLGFKCHHLELFPLDQEIKKLEEAKDHSYFSDKQEEHTKSVTRLKTLRQTLHEDLDAMNQDERCTKKDIVEGEANKVAKDTVKMLKNLRYHKEAEEDNKTYLEEYESNLKNCNKATNFFKAAWVVFLGFVGLIFGSALGLIAGVIAGDGVCSAVAGPVGLVLGAIEGAKYGVELGKRMVGEPQYRSVASHLLFKPVPNTAAKAVASAGMDLMNADAKREALAKARQAKELKEAEKDKGIEPEVLGRYFSYR